MSIIMRARSNNTNIAVFDSSDSKLERLFDSIAKYDCYGIGDKMIERIGQLPDIFGDSEEGAKPYSLLFSNNALMVVFNITSDLLAQKMSDTRMTHTRVLHKRRTVADKTDRTIGQNIRSDVMYGDIEYLSRFISIITPLIYSGDSLVITEGE